MEICPSLPLFGSFNCFLWFESSEFCLEVCFHIFLYEAWMDFIMYIYFHLNFWLCISPCYKIEHQEPPSPVAATRSTPTPPPLISSSFRFSPSVSVSISDSGSESRGSVKLQMYLHGTYALESPLGELKNHIKIAFFF